jgi:hypothetical protein
MSLLNEREIVMENLKGRSVEVVFDGYESRLGEVMDDRGDQVVVYFPETDEFLEKTSYYAKYRLLCSEYAFCDVPSAMGVYLIAKPIIKECA